MSLRGPGHRLPLQGCLFSDLLTEGDDHPAAEVRRWSAQVPWIVEAEAGDIQPIVFYGVSGT